MFIFPICKMKELYGWQFLFDMWLGNITDIYLPEAREILA